MKKIKEFIKKNIKVVIAFILGGIIIGTGGVYAATSILSDDISYDNISSGLTSTNVQDAIDEVYSKTDLRNYDNIVSAYAYDESIDSSTFCVTGEESTCKKTDCYKNKTTSSCNEGDIIKYKVNDTDIVTFHVMTDNGSTLTMQSQKNIVEGVPWISQIDYVAANGDCSGYTCNEKGPITAMASLERATNNWTNVNLVERYQYFYRCSKSNLSMCDYTDMPVYTNDVRARMMTINEASYFSYYRPIWMHNYLAYSASSGGTADIDSSMYHSIYEEINSELNYENGYPPYSNYGYWLSAGPTDTNEVNSAFYVSDGGYISYDPVHYNLGVRAVVEINK